MTENKLCIVGGDKRYLNLIKLLKSDCYNDILSFGFNKIDGSKETISDLYNTIDKSDIVIFPSPVAIDNFLNMPLSDIKVKLNSDLADVCKGKYILCGFHERLLNSSNRWNRSLIFDYFLDEALLVKNAFLTSEAAINASYKHIDFPINKSNILVCGFGRIGKSLSYMLKGLGASVTISARKDKDIAWIDCLGFKSVETGEISQLTSSHSFDIIYNTIPQLIFDEKIISGLKGSPIIIDLASLPGGIDLNSAKKFKIKSYQELALPGKYFPLESAIVIKDSILNIINKLR